MKAYLLTTATLFALLTGAHIWRILAESTALARDPFFLGVTILSTVMAIWAFRLLRSAARS